MSSENVVRPRLRLRLKVGAAALNGRETLASAQGPTTETDRTSSDKAIVSYIDRRTRPGGSDGDVSYAAQTIVAELKEQVVVHACLVQGLAINGLARSAMPVSIRQQMKSTDYLSGSLYSTGYRQKRLLSKKSD